MDGEKRRGKACVCGRHTWLERYIDRCVAGVRDLINYRGTMAGICVEEERDLPYVLREIDRHPCICVGEE